MKKINNNNIIIFQKCTYFKLRKNKINFRFKQITLCIEE